MPLKILPQFMKKIALLFAAAISCASSQAQLSLTGTSYTQNFNTLSTGLPTGWSVWVKASATSRGIDSSNGVFTNPTLSSTAWASTTGGFKNVASANNFPFYAAGTIAAQQAATDRALGIRQVGQTSTTFPSDTGVAFVLQIVNTTNLSNFSATFKLQSLDSTIVRTANWTVDYGFGTSPTTFTPVTTVPATLTTGGNTYGNNTISVNFGTALNNNAGPVWIRIVNLTGTTGTGSRPTTAIDDFNLSWTGAPIANYKPQIVSLSPANNSSNVATSSTLAVTFDRNITAGTGSINVKNRNTQSNQSIAANSTNVTISGKTATISGVNMVMGATYHVTFDSTAFDTATYHSTGLYDTTDWKFTTVFPTPTALNETFDVACAAGTLPSGWQRQNIVGPSQQWICAGTGTNRYMQMNGTGGTPPVANDNEDWLITPLVNLVGQNNVMLYFQAYKGFTGSDIDVLYSTNYSGTGNPNSATWTSLQINLSNASTTWTNYSSSLASQQIYLAFKYVCSATANNCAQWRVDSVVTQGTNGILTVHGNNQLPITVYGKASSSHITFAYALDKAAPTTVSLYDLNGREVYRTMVHASAGVNQTTIMPGALVPGMYVIRVADGKNYGVTKVIVE